MFINMSLHFGILMSFEYECKSIVAILLHFLIEFNAEGIWELLFGWDMLEDIFDSFFRDVVTVHYAIQHSLSNLIYFFISHYLIVLALIQPTQVMCKNIGRKLITIE